MSLFWRGILGSCLIVLLTITRVSAAEPHKTDIESESSHSLLSEANFVRFLGDEVKGLAAGTFRVLSRKTMENLSKNCNEASDARACLAIGKLELTKVPRTYSILQGATDAKSTQLNVVAQKGESLSFILWHTVKANQPAWMYPVRHQIDEFRDSNWVIHQIEFSGLKKNEVYRLDVYSSDNKLSDSRELSVLDLNKNQGKVAVASCMNDRFESEEAKKVWAALQATKVDLILFIGDNVYADHGLVNGASPDQLWQRYVETRNALPIYKWQKLTPVLATWDDHDYGRNDGDRTFRHKDAADRIFHIFFPQRPDDLVRNSGPGISRMVKIYGQTILLLDGRSFRSPVDAEGEQTVFGAEQERWLMAYVRSSTGPIWLVNGFQFFGGYHFFESYERQHPQSFKTFLEGLRPLKKDILFISGDRHLSELMKIPDVERGRILWELTASSIQAKQYDSKWQEHPNPLQILGVDMKPNFALITVNQARRSAQLNIKVLGAEGKEYFSQDLNFNEAVRSKGARK